MEVLPRLISVGAKVGFAYVKKGVYDFAVWVKRMREALGGKLKDAGLGENEIEAFIREMWKSKLPMDGEVHTIEEWASILGKSELHKKMNVRHEKKIYINSITNTSVKKIQSINTEGKNIINMKTIKDAIYDAFMIQGVNYSEMSIDDIALEIQDKNSDFKEYDLDELRKKVSSHMSNAVTKIVKGKRVENKDSLYQRVKNGKGGYKKGVYKLRKRNPKKEPKKPNPVVMPLENPVTVENNYMGAAGEMAVCSELLFREYNVSRMSVDDGVDIVAMKYNKTYYIQVKTVQVKSASFGVKINAKSYERYNANDCYYIIVARAEMTQFIVTTADDIRRLIDRGSVRGEKFISLQFTQNMGCIFVGEENVNYMLNSFERIK